MDKPFTAQRAFARAVRSLLLATLLVPAISQAAWDATLSKATKLDTSSATSLPDDSVLKVHVSLKIQNRGELETLLKNLYTPGNPQYGRYLTPAQFAAAYSPTAAQAQKVADYLIGAGLSNVSISKSRLLVNATGKVSVIEKAFNTQLVQVQKEGRTVRANVKDMQVPDSLGGIVLAILGPTNTEIYKTGIEQARERGAQQTVFPPLTAKASRVLAITAKAGTKATAGPAVTLPALAPTAWDIAYDAADSPDGSQSTIAISTYGSEDVGVVEDLRQNERQYGLPYVPVEVRETAAFSTPTPTSSGDDEWDLDTQSSTAIAHNVKKLIIYATEDTSDLVLQYNDFAETADSIAGNMSYGTCELDADTGVLIPGPSAADQFFMQASVEGLSWHASTGDDGGVCSPANVEAAPLAGVPLLANYPASSPYLVAVGGTSLTTDASYNYVSETAWLSGGGGISVLEAAPSWQMGIVPSATLTSIPGLTLPAAATGGTGVGRGVPDVAMNAGIYLPATAVASSADTIVGGTHLDVVGTSLASPLATGSWARLQSAHCEALGFAAPAYYALDTAGGLMSVAKGFNDITTGTNGDYVATTGWDYTTGFGSIDLSAVNAALPPAAASCVTSPVPPIAKLSLSDTSDIAPLTTTYDGSASSDPNGDTLTYYTIDYGDDTLPLQQTTPGFDAHTYASPGVYTVSLTVVNSHGAVSTPATKTVTVAGIPPVCTIPGKKIIDISSGSGGIALPVPIAGSLLPAAPDPLPSQDLLTVSVAEPADMPGELVFTMTVSSLSTLPPTTRWTVSFYTPGNTVANYVAMNTDSGTAAFVYGERGNLGGAKINPDGLATLYNDLGTLNAASNYNANGTITLVLDKSSLNLVTGETLQGILATVAVLVDVPPSATGSGTELTVGEAVDAASTRFGYTLIGNDLCAEDEATSGGLTGGTTGTTAGGTTGGTTGSGSGQSGSSTGTSGSFGFGVLPLLAFTAARRRRRARFKH